MGKQDEFIVIASYSNLPLAHIAKGRLEEEGIEVFLSNDKLVSATGYNYLFGGIKLQVRNSDALKAKEILELDE